MLTPPASPIPVIHDNYLSQRLEYCPLCEHETVKSWDKQTISYFYENTTRIRNLISHKIAKSNKSSRPFCEGLDDLMQDFLLYLYDARDYDCMESIQKSKTNSVIPVSAYVGKLLDMFMIRKFSAYKNEHNQRADSYTKNNDGEELSLLDTISVGVEDYDRISNDLVEICKCYEGTRYINGIDIYTIFYISILCTPSEADILMNMIYGTQVKSMIDVINEDSIYDSLCKAIQYESNREYVTKILSRYVFNVDKINKAIQFIKSTGKKETA